MTFWYDANPQNSHNLSLQGVKNVPFQVVTNYTGGWNVQWASEGFLGLQAPSGYDDPPNAVKALTKNTGGEPIVGIVLNGWVLMHIKPS